MIRTVANLPWDCPSPSHWRLALPLHGHVLDVSYLGDIWCLFHASPDGEVSIREFDRRDDAFAFVEAAFTSEPATP